MINYIKNGSAKIWTSISSLNKEKFMILCNGGPGCCDYLEPVSGMIDDEYNVIRFEQRGCGRSVKDGNYDLHTAVSDLEAIRKYYWIDTWVVGGHSWGANLTLVYAIINPDRVKAIIYIAGSGIHDNRHWNEEFHRKLEEVGEELPDMEFPFNQEVNAEGNRTLREFGRAPDFYLRVAKLTVPSLFIVAENDIRPSWPVEQLCTLMKNSTMVYVTGAANYIWLTHYNEMKKILRGYLKLIV